MKDNSLQRLIDETEHDLGTLLPNVKERLKKRLVLAYWQGVNDARKGPLQIAADRRSKSRENNNPQLRLGFDLQ